jgi:hypothetical protein
LAEGKLYIKIEDDYQEALENNKELVQRYKYPQENDISGGDDYFIFKVIQLF